ncbi:MAG: hypothetical protein WBK67_01950 [Minisyncoccales bacterium]
MLIPIQISSRKRIWVEVVFRYEKFIYANSPEEISKYVLKYGRVAGIYSDEQISHDITRTVSAMLRDGVPPIVAVEETSALYGIPRICIEEILYTIPA